MAPSAAEDGGNCGACDGDHGAVDGLIQLSRLVLSSFSNASARHRLTVAQAKLLWVLAQSPRTMTELAQRFGVGNAALTGLVDRAEQRGLVERSPVPRDRRALQVTLTDVGRRVATGFHRDAIAELERLLSPLGSAGRASFRLAVDTVVAGARDAASREAK